MLGEDTVVRIGVNAECEVRAHLFSARSSVEYVQGLQHRPRVEGHEL